MKHIRFKFAPAKARAAIHWMVSEIPGIDLHAMLKTCYFADKEHLNRHGRPIFGATYRAMKFGPVPLEIYEMAKCDPIWLAELGIDRFPWNLDGYRLRLEGNVPVDLSVMSDSDVEALRLSLSISTNMSFDARTALTHGKDWQAANLGIMRYEDMLEESPQKEKRVAYLREAAAFLRL